MILKENYTLPNGIEIPILGLDTWFISNTDIFPAVREAVKSVTGILIRLRHIKMKTESEKVLKNAGCKEKKYL